MKKILIAVTLLSCSIYFISCSKSSTPGYFSCTGTSAADDSTVLLAFAKSNNITPTADSSWLYYQIISQGTGTIPSAKSKITVNYVGKFMNGTNFDSTTAPVTFELDSLILGWQYGLPKIQAGGHIKLLVPSALAFGCAGSGTISSNTPLFFDVQLISVQ
ncbi:MAG: FKBP-type peptidyl-prolyl cis-trans isomerase [Bacteroidetes bacterium]|nr:FKBP-type peptidyl-prolyl cis-trans isomerase [Bacteroidota bacterium]